MEDRTIKIWVPGIPQPGGSKSSFAIGLKGSEIPDPRNPSKKLFTKYRSVTTEANRKSKPWRQSVEWSAKEIIRTPLTGPLEVSFVFRMPRLKGHYGKHGLKSSAPNRPAVRPDCTKLVRSTEDALKGIAWIDDSQIVIQHVEKIYSDNPGASIQIEIVQE